MKLRDLWNKLFPKRTNIGIAALTEEFRSDGPGFNVRIPPGETASHVIVNFDPSSGTMMAMKITFTNTSRVNPLSCFVSPSEVDAEMRERIAAEAAARLAAASHRSSQSIN